MSEKTEKTYKTGSLLKKNSLFYWVLLIVWLLLSALFIYIYITKINSFTFAQKDPFNNIIKDTTSRRVAAIIFITLNAIFLMYFWLNGIKDFLYVCWYYLFKKIIYKQYKKVLNTDVSNVNDKVLLVYCCCNDIVEDALSKCINQDYKNYDVVILDDSTKPEEIQKVNNFVKTHPNINIKIVRRSNRKGFKAGNLNHYLMSDECKSKNYKYYVILDSDEIIPRNFIRSTLKHFYAYENIGIVQANHIATNNKNFFMDLFHRGVNSHWPVYQTMKHKFGFSTMLGHGAMIKAECYDKLDNGFPPMVAEDLCISIELRSKGYLVSFAPEIICQEEYPVDYIAFKKRHSKWTQGNLEFIKKFTKNISKAKMNWFEKMDIFLFTYNLPLTALFSFYIFINIIVLPLIGVNLGSVYPAWFLIPTIIFFFSPMINDFIYWIGRMNFFKFIIYFPLVFVLYGSMFLTSLISAILGIFGKKATFIVTPKSSYKYKFVDMFKYQWKELIFSLVLIGISLLNFRNIWPVSLITISAILSMFLIYLSNIQYNQSKIEIIDQNSSRVSIQKIQKIFIKQCNYDLKLYEQFNLNKIQRTKINTQ
ncbi:glycosyltransferase family 2 protein [Mycoplasmopsis felifaucium]|uniref:Glycosyltransferase family 2 protein n=1 Tax=Mycoplasmopsis felifaucium TaxID=35768 RepID=A0ABZ2RPV3_9BACT